MSNSLLAPTSGSKGLVNLVKGLTDRYWESTNCIDLPNLIKGNGANIDLTFRFLRYLAQWKIYIFTSEIWKTRKCSKLRVNLQRTPCLAHLKIYKSAISGQATTPVIRTKLYRATKLSNMQP